MQKVFKNGNSLAVTIPKTYAHEINITKGSTVEWEKTEQGLFLKTQKPAKQAQHIDPEVVKLISRLSKKYSQVWEELAKI